MTLCEENHKLQVEARVQDLLEAVDIDPPPPKRIRPCNLQKLIEFLKLRGVCEIDGIPNECLRQLPKITLVHLTMHSAFSFPKSWNEAKIITLLKPGKDPKLPQNLRSIRILYTTGKLFEKVIIKILQRHIDERNLRNANQFEFRANHSTTLQCMMLRGHITLNFNNKMSTAAVFLDIEKAFDTLWHPSLLYINYLQWNFQPI
jgi:hypothetical protein